MYRYMQAHCRFLPPPLAAIHSTLSTPRMAEYMHSAQGDAEQALRLYLWNARICEALLFPMQVLEVSVRNAISEAAQKHKGPKWTKHRDIVSKLDQYWIEQLRKARKRVGRDGHYVTTDRIIAGISFGFWCHLLAVRFEPVIWPKGVRVHFPYISPEMGLSELGAELDRLSKYRNRIAHHKSIYDRKPEKLLSDITNFISHRCPDTATYVAETCCLEWVLSQRPAPADLV